MTDELSVLVLAQFGEKFNDIIAEKLPIYCKSFMTIAATVSPLSCEQTNTDITQ